MPAGPRSAPAFQPSLKGRALRLLSQREHSRKELERKLAAHEETPGELHQALDELQAKGLDAALVTEALQRLKGTELERAREVWRRKFDALPHDAATRAKQSRFLAARGFGGEVIRKVLAGGAGEED